MELIDTIKNLSVSRRRSLKDDDFFVDRLHHRYTVAVLVLFCAIITTNQYAGEPINCWVPAQFTGSFETYTNRLCWLQNTYYVDQNTDIPDELEERHKSMLKYYQWVHLIILLQSMLFLIPRILWRSLNDKCGIEIVNYVDAAMKYETVDKYAEREKLLDFLSGHIDKFIEAKQSYKDRQKQISYKVKRIFSFFLFWTGKRFGNYLIILYIFCKLLYLCNVFGQLFLMTKLLGISNYHMLGFEILRRMSNGENMISNHYFPKVTHCDFKIRELGSDHLYTVQCVLTINIFTEKIYVILWFWFVILTVITCVDLFSFIIKNLMPFERYKYVKKHVLVFSKLKSMEQKKLFRQFAKKYLKPDVVLVFKIIATNVNGVVVSELIKQLWDSYVRAKSNNALENLEKLKQEITDIDDDDDDDVDDEDDYNEDIDKEDEYSTPKFPLNENDKKTPSKKKFRILSKKDEDNYDKDANVNDTKKKASAPLIATSSNIANKPISMV